MSTHKKSNSSHLLKGAFGWLGNSSLGTRTSEFLLFFDLTHGPSLLVVGLGAEKTTQRGFSSSLVTSTAAMGLPIVWSHRYAPRESRVKTD